MSMLASLSRLNELTLMELARIAYKTTEPTKNQMRGAQMALKNLLESGKIVQSPYRDDKGNRCFSLPGGARRIIKPKLTSIK